MYRIQRRAEGWVIISPYTLGQAQRTIIYRSRDKAAYVCSILNRRK